MTTLVTGCRGRIGSTLVSLLHRDGHAVRAASRTPGDLAATATALPAGVPVVACDLGDPATFGAALDGVDSVFLYADPSGIDAFLSAAETAGVGHIVLLSSSSALAPDAHDNPIAASHHAVEQALTASPLTTTLLRPGAFASNAYQWAQSVRAHGSVDLPYPDSHTSPIDGTDIAEAALAVLTDPRLQGAAYHLTGPESLTAAEQVGLLAAASGRPITVNTVTGAAWKESMAAFLPEPIADALLAYSAASDGSPAEVTGDTEKLTGHPARTFAAWAEEHAAAFRP
ncbi:NAD(P)H-binding protein [Streptomyces sp. NBC_01591]|uniref:NAD(P)H-binding protein n=1 Tax=Streptomyces sp. NBC_01591 TaxID=2975888 RepID=UPI002DDB8B25|nr:NAD(P)H-binding protein [Streptomyces sp. NBC_01591]WSD69108.1 NAD(P)H-binding protein [Streptomyces sp. NBC_01591]